MLRWRPESFDVQRYLTLASIASYGVIEERLSGLGFTFHLPDTSVGDVVRFLPERRDEGRAKPLEAIVRLSDEVAVIEGD